MALAAQRVYAEIRRSESQGEPSSVRPLQRVNDQDFGNHRRYPATAAYAIASRVVG